MFSPETPKQKGNGTYHNKQAALHIGRGEAGQSLKGKRTKDEIRRFGDEVQSLSRLSEFRRSGAKQQSLKETFNRMNYNKTKE